MASPATAVTYLLGGTQGSVASVSVTPAGTTNTLTARARTYTVAPLALVNISQLTAATVLSRSSFGIGACSDTGTVLAGECAQVDTNGGPNEVIRIDFLVPTRLVATRLSIVDADDSLRLYGVGSGGALSLIGFDGIIPTGFAGTATSTLVSTVAGGNGTYDVGFNAPTAFFRSFVFTSRNNSADGYRINSVTAEVPEPGTWAMMLGGFALAGIGLRRRNRASRTGASA